jgi:hypothetical protein
VYQRYPGPCDEFDFDFIEMKYFEEDIIGEDVDHNLVWDIELVSGCCRHWHSDGKNTNREIVLHKGLLPQDVPNARGHASRDLQRSRHPDSKF